jgi:hypothetical protein
VPDFESLRFCIIKKAQLVSIDIHSGYWDRIASALQIAGAGDFREQQSFRYDTAIDPTISFVFDKREFLYCFLKPAKLVERKGKPDRSPIPTASDRPWPGRNSPNPE